MPEIESPADRLRKLIAEERGRNFVALEPYREVIQTEVEMGTPIRCLVRNLAKLNVSTTRYILNQYLEHIGLEAPTKRKRKPAGAGV